MKGPYVKKRRDACVLLLDDAFDSQQIAQMLRDAGFQRVERFTDHFPGRPKTGDPQIRVREQNVLDPRVIRLGNKYGWLIVTTDSNMRYTHLEEIKRNPEVAILAAAHNRVSNPLVWAKAIINGKSGIERKFKKQLRPWCGQFDINGRITTCYTVTDQHKTRRNRPREQGVAAQIRA